MSKTRTYLLVSIALLFAVSAFAVDGVVLINQATVMAAGGFPYYISQPGSYKLSGNLVVTGDANSCGIPSCDAIHIFPTDNVTLDLNGFTISGPNVSASSSNGILAVGSGVTIENGHITGFQTGVNLIGSGEMVRGITVSGGTTGVGISGSGTIADTDVSESVVPGFESDTIGVSIGGDGLILRCRVTKTPSALDLDSFGIGLGGGLVSESEVSGYSIGMFRFGSASITNNSIHDNGRGLFVQSGRTGYGSNTFVKNVFDVALVGGSATSMKNNVCSDGSVC